MTDSSRQRGYGGTASVETSQTGTTADQRSASEMKDEAIGRGQEAVGEAAAFLKEQASSRLSEQISGAADQLGSVAEAARAVGKQLREKDQAPLATYTDQAADQVERAAHYLEGKNLDQLMSDAERFATRQPALFLGGAFVLGLMAARFLKSSGSDVHSGQRQTWRSERWRGGYNAYVDPYGSRYATRGDANPPPRPPMNPTPPSTTPSRPSTMGQPSTGGTATGTSQTPPTTSPGQTGASGTSAEHASTRTTPPGSAGPSSTSGPR